MQSSPIEKIAKDGIVYAIIVRSSLPPKGYNFVSDSQDYLQVGVNHYAAGLEVAPHYHPTLARSIDLTQEVLHLAYGAAGLVIYDDNQKQIHSTGVGAGDTIIFLRGGHSMSIVEDTRIVEVKQGPYYGPEKDKIRFTAK